MSISIVKRRSVRVRVAHCDCARPASQRGVWACIHLLRAAVNQGLRVHSCRLHSLSVTRSHGHTHIIYTLHKHTRCRNKSPHAKALGNQMETFSLQFHTGKKNIIVDIRFASQRHNYCPFVLWQQWLPQCAHEHYTHDNFWLLYMHSDWDHAPTSVGPCQLLATKSVKLTY